MAKAILEGLLASAQRMILALTIFGLDDMSARYASYEDLAQTIRYRFKNLKRR
jgi:serine/threonine-protein kinase HipA